MFKGKNSCGGFLLTALAVIVVVGSVGGIAIYGAQNTIGVVQQQIRDCEQNIDNVSDADLDRCSRNLELRGPLLNHAAQGLGLVGTIPSAGGGSAGASASRAAVSDAVLQVGSTAIERLDDCPATGGRAAPQALDRTQVARADTCSNVSNPLPADVAAVLLTGCTSGVFACNNGSLICRSLVCNGRSECGDGSDESVCGTELSCCQATNGCPGETATSCAESCCCCPYGEVCDRDNPANGCVRASLGGGDADLEGRLQASGANCGLKPQVPWRSGEKPLPSDD